MATETESTRSDAVDDAETVGGMRVAAVAAAVGYLVIALALGAAGVWGLNAMHVSGRGGW